MRKTGGVNAVIQQGGPPVDRLRVPLQLLIAGCGTAIARSLLFMMLVLVARTFGTGAYRLVTLVQPLLAVVVGGLLVGGAAMVSSQKRPGHGLALGAAIAAGAGIALAFVNMANGVLGGGFAIISLLSGVVSVVVNIIGIGLRAAAH